MHFPEVREWFDLVDRAFVSHHRNYHPSQVIFPSPRPGHSGPEVDDTRLWEMDCGPEAIFAANQAIFALLGTLQIQPHAVVGHSTGEYSALYAAGIHRVTDERLLVREILELNELYEQARSNGQIPEGVLLAVGNVDPDFVLSLVQQSNGHLHVAMDNCPQQIVLCGTESVIEEVLVPLRSAGAICTPLPFSRAYHTPLFRPFCEQIRGFFEHLEFQPPEIPVYSCATAEPFPQAPDEIRALTVEQWARPVRFRETINAMYDAGVRLFVEVGPRNNLTGFVDDILPCPRTCRAAPALPSSITWWHSWPPTACRCSWIPFTDAAQPNSCRSTMGRPLIALNRRRRSSWPWACNPSDCSAGPGVQRKNNRCHRLLFPR
jgi:acyl transferase domain-containing protein